MRCSRWIFAASASETMGSKPRFARVSTAGNAPRLDPKKVSALSFDRSGQHLLYRQLPGPAPDDGPRFTTLFRLQGDKPVELARDILIAAW